MSITCLRLSDTCQTLTRSRSDVSESCGQSARESSDALLAQDDGEGVKEVVVVLHVLQRALELQPCFDRVG